MNTKFKIIKPKRKNYRPKDAYIVVPNSTLSLQDGDRDVIISIANVSFKEIYVKVK